MARKKKHPEHVNHERWLISYADFITLLFAFFVVLFSSSQVDKPKVGKIAKSVQVAFQDLGIFSASTTNVPISDDAPIPFNSVQSVEPSDHTGSLGKFVPKAKSKLGGKEEPESRAAMQKAVEKSLQKELLKQEVHLRSTPEGLVISLGEVGFFDSGSAEFKPAAQNTLAKIAAVLQNSSLLIQIEGHTDNVPIHNAHFGSNWELSTSRATELTRLLIERYGIPAGRLAASGYAEYHPIADNVTAAGKTLNRRVDIILRTSAAMEAQPDSKIGMAMPAPHQSQKPPVATPAASPGKH